MKSMLKSAGIICLLILVTGLFSFTDNTDNKSHLNDIRIERHKAIPMSDGVILYGDVYLPSAPGKYPTLITRTPYGVQRDGAHETLVRFAQHGYAVITVDVRGRYESEGKWEPFRYEGKDGYDIIEWAAAQPFSNGKIGYKRRQLCAGITSGLQPRFIRLISWLHSLFWLLQISMQTGSQWEVLSGLASTMAGAW